jgi:alpha-beta hydrolase superfamily lysophospholipase
MAVQDPKLDARGEEVSSRRELLDIHGEVLPVFVHLPRPDLAAGTWLALIPPFAHEHGFALRPLYELGEALAERGVGVIRLDPQGQGNSRVRLEDASVAGWLGEMAAVLAWLREEAGAVRCVAAGVRLGGLIALNAAAGDAGWDAALAISAPPSGEDYWRDLVRKQRLRNPSDPPSLIDLRGNPVPSRLIAEIRELRAPDLSRALLIESTATPGTPSLGPATVPGARGEALAYRPFWAYEDVHASAVLAPAVLRLLESLPPGRPAPPLRSRPTVRSAAPAERPVSLIEEGEVVRGVLHEAIGSGAPGDIAALLLDGGGSDCCGPHRILLECARGLAASGIPALRHDSRGRGESGGRICETTMSLAELLDIATMDALAWAEWLRAETGCRRLLLVGYCEGAEIAFLLAGTLRLPAYVVGWAPFDSFTEETVAFSTRFLWNATPGFLRKLASPATWARWRGSETDFGGVMDKHRRQAPKLPWRSGETGEGVDRRRFHGSREMAPDLSTVAGALAVWAGDDPLTPQAGEHYRRLCDRAGVRLDEHAVPACDHGFHSLPARRQLLDATLEWVKARGLASP